MGSTEVPKKHKACVYDNPGTISTKVQELDTAEPGNGEVLVHLYAFSTVPFRSTDSVWLGQRYGLV